jgi:hypothetical protein
VAETTTTTQGPPDWMIPYYQDYLSRAQQTADMPYNPYQGQTVAQMNPYQTGALDATATRAMQGSPVVNAASGELQRTLGGDYLNQGNPYLTNVIDKTLGDVTRNYNNVIRPQQDALMARSGSFGNSGVQSTINDQVYGLAGQLGGLASQMRYQDYGAERNRMGNAVTQAPMIANQDYVDANALGQAGAQYQGQEQANLSDQYRRFQESQNYPRQQLDIMGKGLGIGGQTGTNTVQSAPGTNPWLQGVGALGSLASLYGSGKSAGWWGGSNGGDASIIGSDAWLNP